MIVITELLGTDPFSGSRIVINANFQSILSEINLLENNLGISVSSGNIDISAATGGQIKAKTGAFNNIQLPSTGVASITLNGTTGAIVGNTISVATTASLPTLASNNLTMSSLGQSIFNGAATFNSLVKITDGLAYNKVSITSSEHTVINSDRVIIVTLALTSPGALILTPDPSLVDGHVVTIVDASNYVGTVLDTTYILGFNSGSITFNQYAYKSSITLQWSLSDNKWIVIGSSNMTIV
jgi:hypothetical protein